MNIPRCMSTQHPDNVKQPFFAKNSVLNGDDEVEEAYYVFSKLNIHEQMWDAEGKETDTYVVKKLLTKYPDFFIEHMLGKECRLTLRIPNPAVEKNEAKVASETLETIPRSFDAAQSFGQTGVPISEVILPMTQDARDLERVYQYYKNFVVGKQNQKVHDISVKQWVGEFKPEEINVIPLVEDKKGLMSVADIVGQYIKGKKLEHQRVFLARSDPALNYGMMSAILLSKFALFELEELEKKISLPLYPIIGVGSVPFRGNFSPDNINCLKGYPSGQTFLIQSAFKYDHPAEKVRAAVDKINETKRGKAIAVDKKKITEMINRFSGQYTKDLKYAIPTLQMISKHIPKRRTRKLHVGLFGYSRGVGEFQLPRAITFCASLYSVGMPPELLGLSAVTEKDVEYLDHGVYKNMFSDVKSALQYVNLDVMKSMAPELVDATKKNMKRFDVEVHDEHKKATDDVVRAVKKDEHAKLHEAIVRAGTIRKFLG